MQSVKKNGSRKKSIAKDILLIKIIQKVKIAHYIPDNILVYRQIVW